MSVSTILGVNAVQPYATYWSRFQSALVDTPAFARMITKNFRRMRCVTKTNELTETENNPGGGQGAAPAHRYWCLAVKAADPSIYILYGIDPGDQVKFYPPHFAFYKQRMLYEVAWARDNGMDGFQVGNEHEVSHAANGYNLTIATLSRSSNVATAVFSSAHGLTNGDEIAISGATPSTFNVADNIATGSGVSCTVVNSTTITYPNTGADESASGSLRLSWTYKEEREKVKECAVEARAIAPDLDYSYACSQGYQAGWIADGITPGVDLDKISFNIYGNTGNNNYSSFKTTLDQCWATFGTNMILTESNASDPGTWNSTSIDGLTPTNAAFYKKWEADMVARYNYAEALGVQEIYLFQAWSGNNVFPILYNTTPYNGLPSSSLELEAIIVGNWLPVIDLLHHERKRTAFIGTFESQ